MTSDSRHQRAITGGPQRAISGDNFGHGRCREDEGARRGGDEKGEGSIDGALKPEVGHCEDERKGGGKDKEEGDDRQRIGFAKSVEEFFERRNRLEGPCGDQRG